MPRVLLLSAYDVDSHRRWRVGLEAALPELDWTVLTLPPRHFRWRIRGNPVSWALAESEILTQTYDYVLATSMVDCATLRGLYPHLAQCPWICYFHENQLAYPVSDQQHQSIDPAMVNIYSAMACDTLVFNSDYNRRSFLSGLQDLVNRLPDHVDQRLLDSIAGKTLILPVPLEEDLFQQQAIVPHQAGEPHRLASAAESKENALDHSEPARQERPLRIAWNHRVEYDKGTDELYDILHALREETSHFELVLLGLRFRQQPESFTRLSEEFKGLILYNDYAESLQGYRQWLASSDVVLSTAIHEFQGLAVMEAVALRCRPVVPDRLSYPELFAAEYRYQSVEEAVARILSVNHSVSSDRQLPDMSPYSWSALKPRYRDLFR